MYKPLPKELRLGFSDIHDIGVFAKEPIPMATNFGMTHLQFGENLIRTPLGGFLNHSDKPNCGRSQTRIRPGLDKWNIIVTENISAGSELTLKYIMYDPAKPPKVNGVAYLGGP